MSTFSYTPDFGSQKQTKPRVNNASFGDGYTQRIAMGINTIPQVWNLQFANRTQSERDGIVGFFETCGGVTSFDWTPPNASASIKVICQDWSESPQMGLLYTIAAVFTQVYDL